MKKAIAISYLMLLLTLPLTSLYAFGPPGMAKPGVYRSNAAGLPLEKIGELEDRKLEGEKGEESEKGEWLLVVKQNEKEMEETLFYNQEPLSSRLHLFRDGERVIKEYDRGKLIEEIRYSDEDSAIPMPGGDQNEVFRYSNGGSLIAVTDEEQHMLFANDLWGIVRNQNSEGSFFLTKGDEEIFHFWKESELLRTERSTVQADNGWREESVSDGRGEIIRLYDKENRIRTVRTRGNLGYSLHEYRYPSPKRLVITYRSRGIDEESSIWKSLDGEVERVIVQRDGETFAEIEELDGTFLHTIYDDGEKAYQESIKDKELKGLGNTYPSLSMEGALW